ncbi:TaqI-like C-terminal specificity domain-containing protein [uncultured Brachyspira sp.]|uniref:Eco57I restriction-modification methylase domain-containing protein n=1 Tax=uncultured Brachyspira sp. TaxID=221953 RepID=UPI00262046EF|nr:TaqI-like C-terminal specificity domain-containing protein [uncultured Brachyspira sp.]
MAKNSNTKNNTVNNFKFDEAYDKNKWAEHLGENFTEKYGSISSEEEILEKNKDFLKSVIWIGDLNVCDNNDETIGVYEVRITNTRLASRVKISRLCSKILSAGEYGKGIFFILYEDKEGIYRVSYVKHDRIGVFVGNAIEIKKDYSNPKRYTFLLGEGIKVHTPQSRLTSDIFKSVASIENAFSVEGVNKEFYNGVKKYFEYIHNDVIKYFDKDENKAKEFALRFLGRVLFCWFLREKELIPNDILNSVVFENLKYKENYYSDVLEDLFFNVLNMDMEKRKFSKDRVIYNYEKSIPFLNGGLFSKKEDDEAVKTIDDNIIKELFEFFDMYNFTVDESAPFDVEISIDPEMLGRIFENLLAEINPETEKSAKDESGSFYTPREIVDYMVIEAIKLYLYKKLPDMKDKIDGIFDVEESIEYSDKERELILKNIHDMIILDPACGSGAFPLGILQRVFNVIDKLDPKHEYYKELTLKDVTDPIVKAKYEKFYSTKEFNYIYKLFILQKSIYGVDIQPIAIEISRLRAFLSLIIDEEKNEKEDNLGINPLPNLDFQFICANTLVPLKLNPTEKMFIEGHIKNLRKSVKNYFNIHDKNDKKVAENDVEAFFEQIERDENLERETKNIICSWHPFKNKPALYFDYELQFGLDRKFDIVIGNPPYGLKLPKNTEKTYKEIYGSVPDLQIQYWFLLLGKKLISNDGYISYIIPNSIMFNVFAENFRMKLLENKNLVYMVDLSQYHIFKYAKVRNIIITLSNRNEDRIKYIPCQNINSLKELLNKKQEYIDNNILNTFIRNWSLIFLKSKENLSIVKKIVTNKNTVPLENYYKGLISQGVIAYDKYRGQSEETIKSRKFHSNKRINKNYKKWLYGEDITPYSVKWNEKEYFNYCDEVANPRKPFFFNSKRVLIREVTNPSIYAAYSDEEMYHDPSIIVIVENSENPKHLLFLLGLLNSKLMTFYHFNSSPKASKGLFPKLLIDDIKKLPIIKADDKIINQINKLVHKCIELKENDETADIKLIQNDIDKIIYKLYNITEDEIKIIEGNF